MHPLPQVHGLPITGCHRFTELPICILSFHVFTTILFLNLVFTLDMAGGCSSHLPDAGVLLHLVGHVELHLDRAVAVHQPPAAQRGALLGEGARALCALQRLRNEPGVGRLIRRLVRRLPAILYIHVHTSNQNGVGMFCFEPCARTSELAAMKATSAASSAAFSAVLKLKQTNASIQKEAADDDER